MSIRWKIAGALAAIGLLATVAVGVVGYRTTEQRLLQEVDAGITQATSLLTATSGNNRIPQQRAVFDIYAARRFSPAGEITGSTFETEPAVDEEVVRSVSGNGGDVVRRTITLSDGERFRIHTIGLPSGAVEIARSLDESDRVLDDLRRRTMVLVVLAALVAAVVGWLLADRVAAPLRRLARTADHVRSTGRLDVSLAENTARDEVGMLSTAFASMIDALRRSRADQERLVQDAGHELRTPLTSLRTNLSVMRRHADMPSEMRSQILDDLESEVGELTQLVNELVAAASGGLNDDVPEPIDLAATVIEVAERVARRRSRDIVVEAPEAVMVVMPRAGLERAITNVVDNACKFDPNANRVVVRVAVIPGPEPGGAATASLRVDDRGPGIPDADIAAVFERFHRSDATRAMPGSGLGLAIVREVVVSHGGRVFAANREGGGATVGFDLPLAPPGAVPG